MRFFFVSVYNLLKMSLPEADKIISENESFLRKVSGKKPISDISLFLHREKEVRGEEIRNLWTDFARRKRPEDTIGFYTHFPFCAKKCSYCIYASNENDGSESDSYLKRVFSHYEYFSDVFQNISFTNLYFGGGTPNMMSDAQIDLLLRRLYRHYKFDDDGEKTFEGNPAFSTPSKLRILKDHGINRLSFGVQSFDEDVLRSNDRFFGGVAKAIADAVEVGFEDINADLIIGLHGDTAGNVIDGFKRLLELGATAVHIYPLQMKPEYVARYFGGNKALAEGHKMSLIEEAMPKIIELADDNGFWHRRFLEGFYTPDNEVSFNFERGGKRDYEKKAYFSSRPGGLNSIFGVGDWSNSNILGRKVNYMIEKISENPADDVFRATFFSEREWLADYIEGIFFANRIISRFDFREKFGSDIYDYFPEEMALLERDGMIKAEGDKIFFTSPDGTERVKYLLSFFDRNKIKEFDGE